RDESGVSDFLDVDSKMSDALFDVEVPADLRIRLLDLLTTNEDPLGNSMPETWASQAVNVTAELVAAESPRLPPASLERCSIPRCALISPPIHVRAVWKHSRCSTSSIRLEFCWVR
ncbi:MAG: hypothetical protein MK097_19785, partial [Dechloromonas sp.]|nr:hypothetical protein [Dechloromonas sp.]